MIGREILTNETDVFAGEIIDLNGYTIFKIGSESYLMGFTGTSKSIINDIPSQVTQIYKFAFEKYSLVQLVLIHDNITEIDEMAFYRC